MQRMPDFAVASLLAMARAHMEGHEPSQVLGTEGDPYLERWYLHRDRAGGSVYLHRTLRSDNDPELHDHAWDNQTILLDGILVEELPGAVRRTLRPGDVIVRKAEDRHRLEIEAPTITLFTTGPWRKEWGFWHPDPATEGGFRFVHNQDHFRMRGYF